MDLTPYDCTIRLFNPEDGGIIAEHVLPVNSPDPEYAAASTLANAATFTDKTGGGMDTVPVAFRCVKIERRN